jgi:Reverse transcriptase (RNA-dependent DNA polymerase)
MGDISTKGADLVTTKVLINDIISTPNCRATALDIKDFYLNNELPTKEYIRMRREHIPDNIWAQYNLDDFVDDQGWVYSKVSKGMYGLPQAGRVASDALLPRLALAGYKPTRRTPGLFKHSTNSIKFWLVVDDFLVGSCNPTHTEHLKATLPEHYTITKNAAANRFCGMTLHWDYQAGHVDISMQGYIEKALQKFTHAKPTWAQHAPSKWSTINYGAPVQYADPEDTSLPLDKASITKLQQIIGTPPPILCQGSQQHHASSLGNPGLSPVPSHHPNHGRSIPPAQLCRNPPRCHHPSPQE